MVKGWYSPSTKDSGTNGSLVDDFFWGTDLYPNILGWDVKQTISLGFIKSRAIDLVRDGSILEKLSYLVKG
jgi:hypothetical protein